MANSQSSDIGKGFSWKDPSANLGKWVPLGTEQEWEQRKRELDIKMNLEKEKLEMRRRLMQPNLDDYICVHGVCYLASSVSPSVSIGLDEPSVSPSSTKTPSPVSPLNIKEGIPPTLVDGIRFLSYQAGQVSSPNYGSLLRGNRDVSFKISYVKNGIQRGELLKGSQILEMFPEYDIKVYPPIKEPPFITEQKARARKHELASILTEMHRLKAEGFRNSPSMDDRREEMLKEYNELNTLYPDKEKLAVEKPLDTHPTVLTWLIRKVELWDILDIFYYLDKIGERNCLLVHCDSFSAAFRALGNTRLYMVPGFDYNALRKKYFEDDGKGYFSGELVDPIIR